jgi:FlaA1/EpsC-like NDP-sugar epimerase
MSVRQIARAQGMRIGALLVIYTAVLFAARWLAFQLRFDFVIPFPHNVQLATNWIWVIPLKLLVFALFGQFGGLLSYFSIPDLARLVMANGVATAVLFAIRITLGSDVSAPRGVLLLDFILSTVALAAVRLGIRIIRDRYRGRPEGGDRRVKRVGIVGAGDVGASLAKELSLKRGLGLRPVAFFDDDQTKWNLRLHDIQVVGAPEILLDPKTASLELDEVIIAMPAASPKRVREVVALLQKVGLRFETVPAIDQLATGRVKVSQLREVEIEDLLGRDTVELETQTISKLLNGRIVMVTGAGGSIGSELCRQIASFNPQRLLMVEQSEVQIFQIEQEMIERGHKGTVLALVADVLDPARMRQIFERFRPAVVFHAAAHKHVPMMESQPGEAIKNNCIGTARMCDLALEYDVERFVVISTDKAINPTNVMGATKRLAEIYMQSLHAANPGRTRFMAVRFGNVLGSSGSVIPIFKKQIAAGGPVKVTHPDVTRYFMTISEAVGLVLQSATQGEGGEIFVLDMGKPVKIVDLARQMIELSGFKPGEDIDIEFVGLRPGEKLFEELSYQGEHVAPTVHAKIMRLVCTPADLEQTKTVLHRLVIEIHHAEPNQLKQLLKQAVPEYQPYLTGA